MLFYLSHQPALPVPMLFPGQDKLFHLLAYGVLGILLLCSHPWPDGGYSKRQVAVSVLIASLYGISDEFHQSFVVGRSSEALDWLADTAGALLAATALMYVSRLLPAARH